MKVCKRLIAGLAVFLAALGLLVSVVVGVGVWVVKEPATQRATHIFERIEAALDLADQGLDHVKTSLARAAERLDRVKEEQRQLAQEPRKAGAAQRFLARTVQRAIVPELGNASEKLHTVAEAAVVVNSILEDVGNLPFLDVAGLDVGRLTELNSRLAEVGPAAWELSRLLGDSDPESEEKAAGAQLSKVEQTLQTLRALIADYEPRLKQVRDQTAQLKSWTLPWILPGSVLVSCVCLWIALSQISVMAHAVSWWKASRS
jgi:hypothetical protein